MVGISTEFNFTYKSWKNQHFFKYLKLEKNTFWYNIEIQSHLTVWKRWQWMNIQCFNQMGEFYIEAYEANSSWDKANSVLDQPKLPCFSKTQTLKFFKATFTITFFAGVNHNYKYKQLNPKHRNKQSRSKCTCHKSQTVTFWTPWGKLLGWVVQSWVKILNSDMKA